jgi:hypothetical protein
MLINATPAWLAPMSSFIVVGSALIDPPLHSKAQGLCHVSEPAARVFNPGDGDSRATITQHFSGRTLGETKLILHEQLACQLLVNYSGLCNHQNFDSPGVEIEGFLLPN